MFNWSEVHLYRRNFLQNQYFKNFSGSTSTTAPSSSPPRKSPTPTFRKSPTPTFRKSPTPTFRKSPTPTFRKSPTPTFTINSRPCCPQDPCGDCDLCRPALQKQQQQQNRPRPPSPTEPHPDEVKALNFASRTPEQTNNFQASPSPSPSPPPSAKNREATPLRQTSKNIGISLIPPLPVFSSIPEISTVPGLASMVWFIRYFHQSRIPNLLIFLRNIYCDFFFNWQTEKKHLF